MFKLLSISTTIMLASASAAIAATNGPVTVWFGGARTDISDRLALLCSDRDATVIEQDDRHVLCQRKLSGAQGVLNQALLGNPNSTQPMLNIRFSILKDRDEYRVQATQWVQLQSAYGQIRRREVDGIKPRDELLKVLLAAGGHETYAESAAADNPTGTVETPTPEAGSWNVKVRGLKLKVTVGEDGTATVGIRSIFKAKNASVEEKMRAAVKQVTSCSLVQASWVKDDLRGRLSCLRVAENSDTRD